MSKNQDLQVKPLIIGMESFNLSHIVSSENNPRPSHSNSSKLSKTNNGRRRRSSNNKKKNRKSSRETPLPSSYFLDLKVDCVNRAVYDNEEKQLSCLLSPNYDGDIEEEYWEKDEMELFGSPISEGFEGPILGSAHKRFKAVSS